MSEIYIYGEIVDEAWGEAQVSGKSFADELKNAKDPVTVRINSPGGSVFAALAISNAVKLRGSVTVAIDGLCASAATLIACAAAKVQMASNALMLIHPPRTLLFGNYNREQLLRFSTTLEKLEAAINATYQSKVKDFTLDGELWLTAQEALERGFVDEITGATELEMFLRGFTLHKEEKFMDNNFFDKLKATLTDALSKPTGNVREEELKRIRDLQGLKCELSAVNAIVDEAISNGETAAQIQKYVDAIKKTPSAPSDVAEKIVAMIRDQMTSGGQLVSGGQVTDTDVKKAQADMIVKFANGLT